jgi:MinD superfamily P-loop ATPase
MHEIVVISGKGGTGKTSLTAAFAHLSENQIICDLDVDAPDLHLILNPQKKQVQDFYSGHEAVIIQETCDACGLCKEMCQFDAISEENLLYRVNPLKCEGCKVCVSFCPANAIDFKEKHCGQWFKSDTRFGPMIHAQLFPAEENSGRLVALLRKQAKESAEKNASDLILSDGTPGIGCPVISSLSGVDRAIIVTEPTVSGRHDLERVVELCRHFKVPAGVVINKYDLNEKETASIEIYCDEQNLNCLGKLPHDPVITEAMINKKAVTEYSQGAFTQQVKDIWENIQAMVQ